MSDPRKQNTTEDVGPDETEDQAPDANSGASADAMADVAGQADDPAGEGASDRVAALEAEVADLQDRLRRALAETENVRRRGQREKEDATKFAIAKFARDLVGVADNLQRAVDSVPAEEAERNEAVKSLLTGVQATERQLVGAFEQAGIARMEPMGEVFDPNYHEVMFEMDAPGQPAGTIVQLLEPGYVIHERLLRPARVAVASANSQSKVDTSV